MSKLILKLLAAATFAVTIAAPASATVATFEDKSAFACPGSGQTDGGLALAGFACYYSNTSPADFPFTPTSTVIGLANFGSGIGFTTVDHSTFSLHAIDIALAVYTPAGTPVTVIGTYAAGGTVAQILAPSATAFSTYVFDWSGLSNVTFGFAGGVYLGLDNIAYNLPAAAAVPEPASLALLAAGLVGLGALRRKRQG